MCTLFKIINSLLLNTKSSVQSSSNSSRKVADRLSTIFQAKIKNIRLEFESSSPEITTVINQTEFIDTKNVSALPFSEQLINKMILSLVVLLDLCSAFDTIDHDSLLHNDDQVEYHRSSMKLVHPTCISGLKL